MIILSTDTTTNKPLPGAVQSPMLESVTGADIMISPVTLPVASEMLIKKHVEAGAVLIQQKNGMDIIHSAQNQRLSSQLARMYEAGAKYSWQRVIMFVGKVEEKNGNAILNGVEVGTWWQWQGIKDSLAWSRGGVFVDLPSLDYAQLWLQAIDKTLPDRIARRYHEVYLPSDYPDDFPPQDDPLQLPIRVTDWRRPMWELCKVANANIGPEILNNLRQTMLDNKADDTFFMALDWITSFSPLLPKVKGLGPKRKKAVKDYVGLYPNVDITCIANPTMPIIIDEQE